MVEYGSIKKMRSLPYFLYKHYLGLGLLTKIYVKLRWRLCPFAEIEKLVPKQAKVIDIGCGMGILSNYMAVTSRDRHVLGIDISEKRINSARKTLGVRKNIEFLLADIKDVKFGECDAVVMTDFLHHISFEQQEKLLKDVFERLRTGGKLILQEIDSSRFFRFLLTKTVDIALNPGKNLFYRDKDSWVQFLCQLGFKIDFFHINILFLPDMVFICEKTPDFVKRD